jgi:hypothetical protein
MMSLQYLYLWLSPEWSYQFGTIYFLYTDVLGNFFHHNCNTIPVFGDIPFMLETTLVLLRDGYEL